MRVGGGMVCECREGITAPKDCYEHERRACKKVRGGTSTLATHDAGNPAAWSMEWLTRSRPSIRKTIFHSIPTLLSSR